MKYLVSVLSKQVAKQYEYEIEAKDIQLHGDFVIFRNGEHKWIAAFPESTIVWVKTDAVQELDPSS